MFQHDNFVHTVLDIHDYSFSLSAWHSANIEDCQLSKVIPRLFTFAAELEFFLGKYNLELLSD